MKRLISRIGGQLRQTSGAALGAASESLPRLPASAGAASSWQVSAGAGKPGSQRGEGLWVESTTATLALKEPPSPSPHTNAQTIYLGAVVLGTFFFVESRLETKLSAKIDGLSSEVKELGRELKGELKEQRSRVEAKFDQEDYKFFQLLRQQSNGPTAEGPTGETRPRAAEPCGMASIDACT